MVLWHQVPALQVSGSVPESTPPPRGLRQEKGFLHSGHHWPAFPTCLKALEWNISQVSTLTVIFPSSDGNKPLGVLESSWQWGLHPSPQCSLSWISAHRGMAVCSSWHPNHCKTEKWGRRSRKILGFMFLYSVPSSFFSCSSGQPRRAVEFYFLAAATQCTSGWPNQCLQQDAIQAQGTEVVCPMIFLSHG